MMLCPKSTEEKVFYILEVLYNTLMRWHSFCVDLVDLVTICDILLDQPTETILAGGKDV